jgi:hypothetical protein
MSRRNKNYYAAVVLRALTIERWQPIEKSGFALPGIQFA